MGLYKGYVKNVGKRPVDNLKGVSKFRTLDEVKQFESYGGVLADDVIMIDIDDHEQSEILMNMVEEYQLNCQVICTERGRHFTFKNSGVTACGVGKKLACGLTADIKVGTKNSVECLKIDGTERFIEWDYVDNKTGILPRWLHPIDGSGTDFFNMSEGDGRDSALYSYILTLTKGGFSIDETRETIRVINRWILKDSLSEDDIERITRDEAFPEETFFKGKVFLHNNFAIFLKNNNHIRRINGQLHIYKKGIYIPGYREIESQMVHYLPMVRSAQRAEVLKYLEIICPENEPTADANLIAFANGIYDIAQDTVTEFSPDIVITNKIPWKYNPGAYSDIADRTLNKIACNDEGVRMVLEEAIGYAFLRRNEMSKAFFLTGSGSNGKSTFLDMLSYVVGDSNRSSLGLEELDERFSIAALGNKLINTGDDISDDFLQGRAIANFKKLVSGNEVKAEYKGQDAFFMKPYAKFFFSANNLPRTKSKGFEAIKRRLIIIPFEAKFSKNDPDYDPYITYKLRDPEVMEYLIRIGITGLKRVLENNAFTEATKVKKELEDYEIENNPILLWLQEYPVDKIVNEPTKTVHKAYKIFCVENGFQGLTLSSFSKELNHRFGLVVKRVRVNGEQIGVYRKG